MIGRGDVTKPDHDIAMTPRSRPLSSSSRTRRGSQLACLTAKSWPIVDEHEAERSRRTSSRMLGAVRTKPACTGQKLEAGQDDEAKGKEVQAGH